ncbi:hypothetical protein RA8P2_00241 (plasmid) [Variovorax sp. RA8]|nr:hypothetical protein RA8P2_00241 [Variovorax sp. RA8]
MHRAIVARMAGSAARSRAGFHGAAPRLMGLVQLQHRGESFVGVLAEEGGATTWVVCHHGPEEERAPVTRSTNHQAALFQ